MAVSMKCNTGVFSSCKASRRALVVRASAGKSHSLESAQLATAAFVAASFITSSANAGVVLQKPEVKKLFQSSGEPAAVTSSSSSSTTFTPPQSKAPAPKAAAPKKAEESSGEGGIDFRALALPVSLAGIAGAGLAASKIDSGFDNFMTGALLKDSNDYAGYEPVLKSGNGLVVKAGTKKVKGKSTKKGGLFG